MIKNYTIENHNYLLCKADGCNYIVNFSAKNYQEFTNIQDWLNENISANKGIKNNSRWLHCGGRSIAFRFKEDAALFKIFFG